MNKLCLAIPVLLVLCGCHIFLPAGDPPEGRITDNTLHNAVTPHELRNQAVTALTAFLLTHPQVSSISVSDKEAQSVLKEASSVAGVAAEESAAYKLEYKDGIYKLYNKDKSEIWQYPANE
jgi:hypothetical protein